MIVKDPANVDNITRRIKYAFEVELKIKWPRLLQYCGVHFEPTGKERINFKTGLPCAEYATSRDAWVWLLADGQIVED